MNNYQDNIFDTLQCRDIIIENKNIKQIITEKFESKYLFKAEYTLLKLKMNSTVYTNEEFESLLIQNNFDNPIPSFNIFSHEIIISIINTKLTDFESFCSTNNLQKEQIEYINSAKLLDSQNMKINFPFILRKEKIIKIEFNTELLSITDNIIIKLISHNSYSLQYIDGGKKYSSFTIKHEDKISPTIHLLNNLNVDQEIEQIEILCVTKNKSNFNNYKIVIS
jgi:hypothetical protein